MLFNSWQFMAFFAAVAGCYFLLMTDRVKTTQIMLLGASLYFYASWNPVYLVLILFSVGVTWASGLFMEKYPARKKLVLAASLILNLSILFFFKYFNFFSDLVNRVGHVTGIGRILPGFSVLLPVGISFYTFQAIGYSIDVYKGTVKAERNLLIYALFVTFFPQLVAGPIERSSNLLPQFKTVHPFDYNRTVDGLLLATWGLFKKVFIADRLAFYVDMVYGNTAVSSGIALLTATVFFAFQILCDFSGYSDIAIGIAKVLGFDLMRNFRHPYFSKSIAEFWRRWHISLSSWFKDYVYIPLGGNRVSIPRYYFNLLATFLISGLWHGAALHFVAWGALHGIYQIAGHFTKPYRRRLLEKCGIVTADGTKRWYQYVQVLFTFAFVCIGWIFFRVPNLTVVPEILKRIFFIPKEVWWALKTGIGEMGFFACVRHLLCIRCSCFDDTLKGICVCVICITILFVTALYTRERRGFEVVRKLPTPIKWLCYYAVFYAAFAPIIWNLWKHIPTSEFVYFQF